ncbi:hypothetical protein J5N97_011670 [Dioscorea zingiberensis]|uniref:Cysteine-rich receptor-like protein kinase 10 n=1 Tax=Dioscorea zingiberensis TaxID=325984 RepID=A0A9D5HNK3_9LILI|nr:hypothetical protein J5N97_011670 [Dioscorea zingiberensis]
MLPLLIVQVVVFQMPNKTNAQDSYILLNCPPDSNYTIPSPYKTDLDRLLSGLIVSASQSPSLFANASVGTVYGFAQCRPDASISTCFTCLNLSISTFAAQCPLQRSAAVRFDSCLLRYSDRRFFSQLSVDTPRIIVNGGNASNPSALNQQLTTLMNVATSEAPKSAARFAAGVRNFSQVEYIFGMVDCTRDLSSDDCARCLGEVVSLLPINGYGKLGAQVSRISCVARFENYRFFSFSLLPSPPPGNNTDTTTTITGGKSKNGTSTLVLAVVVPLVIVGPLLVATICTYSLMRRRRRAAVRKAQRSTGEGISGDCLLFDLGTLRHATNNFSDENKLGEGGFGSVYKGELSDGQLIAVKRFSWNSGQGVEELKNEVDLLAKLQHRNLVRLLGCCLEEEEKLLVYEYLPNTSLNKYLFGEDLARRGNLDWKSRYKIIEGIGRGLLYLHEDSRLRIIHRDLKASNILLDVDMNPKISDFGIAKLFYLDETQGNTSLIAGTYGYMAPEYAMHGQFSTKSDVYSYGVLVLEIVTGQKASGFRGHGNASDLLTFLWQHWKGGKALEMKDQSLVGDNSIHDEQVLRCIQIGLLCVQEDPSERPSMASVVLMLNSSYIPLRSPSAPASFSRDSMTSGEPRDRAPDLKENEQSNGCTTHSSTTSINDVSISLMEPRTNSQDAPLILQCPPDSNYTIPSSYKNDLDRLLSSLITSASRSPALFSNASLGDVYGLAQCRPDASITDCAACLNRSVSTFASQCLLRRSAATRFDLCLLRYSDRRFFSQLVADKPGVIVNGKDAPDPSVFNQQLNALLGEISSVAPKSASRYAVAVKNSTQSQLIYGRGEVISGECLMFHLGILRDATDNFSDANKLGEGGFGSVFKGKLNDGQEIAVKRFAGTSAQGLVELKNEVAFLAKLQHKNLVKLLGCCLEQQEKLLVYEYLPNTSLDRYLFDPVKRQQLDWARRFRIIEGVSRGLVYLHEDSRLKIIHRDLKASNILLDQDMSPRISDFGIAKLFDVDETHGSTTRIAGT